MWSLVAESVASSGKASLYSSNSVQVSLLYSILRCLSCAQSGETAVSTYSDTRDADPINASDRLSGIFILRLLLGTMKGKALKIHHTNGLGLRFLCMFKHVALYFHAGTLSAGVNRRTRLSWRCFPTQKIQLTPSSIGIFLTGAGQHKMSDINKQHSVEAVHCNCAIYEPQI